MARYPTLLRSAVALLFALSAAFSADPPAEKKPPAKDDKPATAKDKRPTTKEEFAELAKQGPRPPWLPFIGQIRVNKEHIHGTVVDVSREFIEIKLKGKEETVKYPPHTLLDTGAVCHWETDATCYLLDDVQKGDVVILGVGIPERGAEMQCFFVSIRERPGGKVPASRKPSTPHGYHEDRQAEIDHAEKGTPLPDHLKPKDREHPLPKKPPTPPPAAADPPVAKPPGGTTAKASDEVKKDEPRRPATKEDFAELAKDAPKPPWLPFIGQTRVTEESIDGTVVDVSREFIEIQLKGKKETVKYPPHTLLDTGAVCHWESEAHCYLLDDVRKGDVVVLRVGTVDKKKGPECFTVMIRERPGGVIPASRKPSWPKPYHVRRQNEIDDAKNGIVRPEKQPDPPKKTEPPAGDPKKKD